MYDNDWRGAADAVDEGPVLRSFFVSAGCLLMTVGPLAFWHNPALGKAGLLAFAVLYGFSFLWARLKGRRGGGDGEGRMLFSLVGVASLVVAMALFARLPEGGGEAVLALALWPAIAGAWSGAADGEALPPIRAMLRRARTEPGE